MSITKGVVTREGGLLVEMALWQSMEHLEKEIKTTGIPKTADLNELAMRCFEKLKEQMQPYEKDYPLCVAMIVGGVEVYFLPNSRIAKDLKKHQNDPQEPFDLTWRALCNPERKPPMLTF